MSLATKYRPNTFKDVLGQDLTIEILNKQLEREDFANCYLITGPSGDGKTTISRILAHEMNKGQGAPIEIDGASNNGVDNVRDIIDNANQRSLSCKYKVYIIDECHLLTNAAWNAFLKCIEEPPKYTVFIFCTTDPQKVPETIKNRCMRFNLNNVPTHLIIGRLKYISDKENIDIQEDAINYIASLSNGSMRDAISKLEYVAQLNTTVTLDVATAHLGGYSYKNLFTLVNAIIDKDRNMIFNTMDTLYRSGVDLNKFIDEFISFVLDLDKFSYYRDLKVTALPECYLDDIKYACGIFEQPEQNVKYYNKLLGKLLDIKFKLKNEPNIRYLLIAMLLSTTED